jgi:LmbE family N-acetylglucosaminyl deacetylase
MNLNQKGAQLFIPDGSDKEVALARTTHLAIGAHQDDLEIMAIDGILACFQRQDRWFTGVVVTSGSGSPRDDLYAAYTDEQMRRIRAEEQKKAAHLGDYAAQFLLDYPSASVKDGANQDPIEDILAIAQATSPEVVYTHNLADKHDTHVGVTLKVIEALRRLPKAQRPRHLYGCEVWRDLDWMLDEEKVAFDCSARPSLQVALLGVFDSQIVGGKKYDLATMGRRRANATYSASHATDATTGVCYAMDLTHLIQDPAVEIEPFVLAHIERFAQDVADRIMRCG